MLVGGGGVDDHEGEGRRGGVGRQGGVAQQGGVGRQGGVGHHSSRQSFPMTSTTPSVAQWANQDQNISQAKIVATKRRAAQ